MNVFSRLFESDKKHFVREVDWVLGVNFALAPDDFIFGLPPDRSETVTLPPTFSLQKPLNFYVNELVKKEENVFITKVEKNDLTIKDDKIILNALENNFTLEQLEQRFLQLNVEKELIDSVIDAQKEKILNYAIRSDPLFKDIIPIALRKLMTKQLELLDLTAEGASVKFDLSSEDLLNALNEAREAEIAETDNPNRQNKLRALTIHQGVADTLVETVREAFQNSIDVNPEWKILHKDEGFERKLSAFNTTKTELTSLRSSKDIRQYYFYQLKQKEIANPYTMCLTLDTENPMENGDMNKLVTYINAQVGQGKNHFQMPIFTGKSPADRGGHWVLLNLDHDKKNGFTICIDNSMPFDHGCERLINVLIGALQKSNPAVSVTKGKNLYSRQQRYPLSCGINVFMLMQENTEGGRDAELEARKALYTTLKSFPGKTIEEILKEIPQSYCELLGKEYVTTSISNIRRKVVNSAENQEEMHRLLTQTLSREKIELEPVIGDPLIQKTPAIPSPISGDSGSTFPHLDTLTTSISAKISAAKRMQAEMTVLKDEEPSADEIPPKLKPPQR